MEAEKSAKNLTIFFASQSFFLYILLVQEVGKVIFSVTNGHGMITSFRSDLFLLHD